ncbi:hypothetical protein PTTG_03933 [Puccinia triticina 1-1 BBBD Race 1]|uniref:Mitochondrial import inner membrane translocase subunit TIM50 n=1 Tax=Puccinia triticina (isolate 1-1 / race 1 (BBBD)) TaxID=630390 RepID=A0A180GIM5_PUCT1|nr:hypothetical protein PTTG_03933 [Puccinia triticina 1-1 BBBD Race 1]
MTIQDNSVSANAKTDKETLAGVSPATAEDSAAVAPSAEDAGKGALEELFKGSETVDDSVFDGYYCIRDMDGFEEWIRERKSKLCKPALEQDTPKKKILVLDLDNTLIVRDQSPYEFIVDCHNGFSYAINIHPACITFLHEMAAHYAAIAIYTSSSAIYASTIYQEITKRYMKAYPGNSPPFYKIKSGNDCSVDDGMRTKNLLMFGSLDDVVFVDDDPYYSIRNQNDNVIHVRRYHGKKSEEGGLMAIAPLLTFLSSVESVSNTMRKLKKVWHNAGFVKVVQCTRNVTC